MARPWLPSAIVKRDVGLQAVESLRKYLMLDKRWTLHEPRGFTWWAHGLAQHVEALPPASDDEHEVCKVRVWTDVAKEVDPARDPAKVLGSLNIHQTLNALVWDPTNGTVAESCTAMVTNENNEKTEGLSKLLTWAALLQNSAAHSRSRRVADSVGGIPAASDHPRSGRRPEMDELLDVPMAVITPAGRNASAFIGPLTEALGVFVTRFSVLGVDANGFTCKVPFTVSRPAVMMMDNGQPPEAALVKVFSDVPHPAFGSGALLTLSLPLLFADKNDVPGIANMLNLVESSRAGTDTTLLGAWCQDPTNDEAAITFRAFVPNVFAQPGLLEKLILDQAVRSRFAASMFGAIWPVGC